MTDEARTGPQSEPTTYNLLFVCTGNTCRSPMAEAIARRMVEERGWAHVSTASAGVAAGTGAPAADHAVAVAREHGLELEGHTSRPMTPDLVAWADLILAMGPSHLGSVAAVGGLEKAALVTSFRSDDGPADPVEDPFGGDLAAYRRTFGQLEAAIRALLDRLEPILSP